MNVLVLYDSKFGNTEKLAQAMAATLGAANEVRLRKVDAAPLELAGFELVLVGGPTEGHGASAPLKTALRSMALGSAAGVRVATFDTRFRMSRVLTGSAGVSAGKLLACVGARIVAGPESFFVTKGKPPALEPGEVERAAGWAVTVARSI